jgi:hypothetical protein
MLLSHFLHVLFLNLVFDGSITDLNYWLFYRLKQMLTELMRQQNQHPEKPRSKERGSSASHPSSPNLFCPFSFPTQPVNLFNLPGFTNFPSFAPGR